jgi:hypothetical protein
MFCTRVICVATKLYVLSQSCVFCNTVICFSHELRPSNGTQTVQFWNQWPTQIHLNISVSNVVRDGLASWRLYELSNVSRRQYAISRYIFGDDVPLCCCNAVLQQQFSPLQLLCICNGLNCFCTSELTFHITLSDSILYHSLHIAKFSKISRWIIETQVC